MIILILTWVVFILGAGIVSLLSYSTAKALADQVSMAGSANRFPLEFFQKIQSQARGIVFLLAPIGVGLFIFRKRIEQFLSEKIPSLKSLRFLVDVSSLSRRELAGLLALIGIGFSLRLVNMRGIVTYDEAFTYFQYAQNPLTAVTVYTHVNNHIFHTLLLSLITSVFGDSYWVLRSIALVCGTLLIPLVFLAIRSDQFNISHLNGWLAAVVISLNPLIVKYSALARGYTLQVLIGVLMWILFGHILRGRRDLVLILGFLSTLALWTIPTSTYFVTGLGFAFLGNVFIRRIKISDFFFFLVITGTVTAVLYMPAVIVSGLKAVLMNPDSNPVAAGVAVDPFLERFKYIWDPLSLSVGRSGGFGLVFLLTLWGLYAAPIAWRSLGIGLCLSIFILTTFFRVTPPTRTWIFIVPLLAVLVDFGVCKMVNPSKWLYNKMIFLTIFLSMAYTVIVLPNTLKSNGPGHREVTTFARQVANQWREGTVIRIEAHKNSWLQSNLSLFYTYYDWYNVYTTRFYLQRQGISKSSFRWREKKSSHNIWLVLVQVDGQSIDLQGPEGKKISWDLIIGPYSLAQKVPKGQLSDS